MPLISSSVWRCPENAIEHTERVTALGQGLSRPAGEFRGVYFAMFCDFRGGKEAGRSIVMSCRFNSA
jgi:hypothetical protein